MSIDGQVLDGSRLRQESAGRREARPRHRCRSMLPALEAAQIARTLTEKYGQDALSFARGRAARAVEIGDELALAAWQSVIEATQSLLRRSPGL